MNIESRIETAHRELTELFPSANTNVVVIPREHGNFEFIALAADHGRWGSALISSETLVGRFDDFAATVVAASDMILSQLAGSTPSPSVYAGDELAVDPTVPQQPGDDVLADLRAKLAERPEPVMPLPQQPGDTLLPSDVLRDELRAAGAFEATGTAPVETVEPDGMFSSVGGLDAPKTTSVPVQDVPAAPKRARS